MHPQEEEEKRRIPLPMLFETMQLSPWLEESKTSCTYSVRTHMANAAELPSPCACCNSQQTAVRARESMIQQHKI